MHCQPGMVIIYAASLIIASRRVGIRFPGPTSRFLPESFRTLLIHHVEATIFSQMLLSLSGVHYNRRRNVSSILNRIENKDQCLPVSQATSRQEPPDTIRHAP